MVTPGGSLTHDAVYSLPASVDGFIGSDRDHGPITEP